MSTRPSKAKVVWLLVIAALLLTTIALSLAVVFARPLNARFHSVAQYRDYMNKVAAKVPKEKWSAAAFYTQYISDVPVGFPQDSVLSVDNDPRILNILASNESAPVKDVNEYITPADIVVFRGNGGRMYFRLKTYTFWRLTWLGKAKYKGFIDVYSPPFRLSATDDKVLVELKVQDTDEKTENEYYRLWKSLDSIRGLPTT